MEQDSTKLDVLRDEFKLEFSTWKTKNEIEIANALEALRGSNSEEDFFVSALRAAFDTSLSHNKLFHAYITNLAIFKQCDTVFASTFEFVCNSTSEDYRSTTRFQLMKLCFAIQITKRYQRIDQIFLNDLIFIWNSLQKVYSIKKYFVFNISFLILSKCLNDLAKYEIYDDVISFTMRTKIYDQSRGLRGSSSNIIYKYQGWKFLFDEWFGGFTVRSSENHHYSFRHFIAYLDIYELGDEPLKFMSQKRDIEFIEYLKDLPILDKSGIHSYIFKFTCWIVDQHMNKEGVYIATQTQIDRFKKAAKSKNFVHFESVKELMPTALIQKCKQILRENDFAWAKSLSWQYFDWINPDTKLKERVWSPSTTYLFLLMFELPVRKIQVQQLDSGEGDLERFNHLKLCWEPNIDPNAGYWIKTGARKPQRGVVTKIKPEGEIIAGLYINTNKTQDIKHDFDERSGYVMPWQNQEVIEIVDEMRNWNSKFNPVAGPLAFKDAPTSCWSSKPNEAAMKTIPDRFYLFRNPCGKNPQAPASQSNLFKFWHLLMLELQNRLIAEGQNIKLVLNFDQQGIPSSSFYTPHGLRVAGLTALYQKGVPIQVLSKLVAGHANLMMTLHYIKFSAAEISGILNKAQYERDLTAQDDFLKKLNNSSFDEASMFAVANSDEAIQIHHQRYTLGVKTSYSGSTIGLCPHNGTACDTGGPIVRKNGPKKAHVYGPVEGGANNCARCRYLITGTPWLINAYLEINKKLADAHDLAKQINQNRDLMSDLEKQKYKILENNEKLEEVAAFNKEIKCLENTIEAKSNQLDELFMTIHALHIILEKIKAITNKSDANGYSLIVNENDDQGPSNEYDVTSRLEIINMLVQAGQIWKNVEDKNFERERNQFLDQLLFESGLNPISYSPLTDQEKRVALDHIAKFLLTNLTSNELIQLENKHSTLADFGLCNKLESTMKMLAPVNDNAQQVIKFIRKA